MAIAATAVRVGTADQQTTTGAIRSDDLVATIPASFSAAATAAAALTTNRGYVSEDGVELSTDISTAEIKEWNKATVRKVLDAFDGTITFSLIQYDYESWCQAIGADNVTHTAANTLHGDQLTIALGAHLPEEQTFAIMLKDGDAAGIIWIPRGQITNIDTITFNATDPIAIPCTLSCYDDGTGNCIYIYTDDGLVVSS